MATQNSIEFNGHSPLEPSQSTPLGTRASPHEGDISEVRFLVLRILLHKKYFINKRFMGEDPTGEEETDNSAKSDGREERMSRGRSVQKTPNRTVYAVRAT